MPNRFFTFLTQKKAPALTWTIEPEPTPVQIIDPEPMQPIVEPPETTYIVGPIVQPESHTLLLLFAEDFFQGHAEVQITLNDEPVFKKPHHVTARRDRMEQEVITIRGGWETPPTVGIIYANDLWHGTDETDRNLFFYGGAYDGFRISVEHKFFRNGTIHFVPDIA